MAWFWHRKTEEVLSVIPAIPATPYWFYGDRFRAALVPDLLPPDARVETATQHYKDNSCRVWQLQIRRVGRLVCVVNFQYGERFKGSGRPDPEIGEGRAWDWCNIRVAPGMEYAARTWRHQFDGQTSFQQAVQFVRELVVNFDPQQQQLLD